MRGFEYWRSFRTVGNKFFELISKEWVYFTGKGCETISETELLKKYIRHLEGKLKSRKRIKRRK